MKRFAPLFALLLTGCAAGEGGDQLGPRLKPEANPSAVIAAEIAFNQLAQEKGQWTAFRETAAEGAEMFVPARVKAQDWLKGRANPTVSVKWQPYEVWSSADGSLAVTRGAWQRPNSTGFFVTAWQRQKDGHYKWVLDQGDSLSQPLAAPEMIQAHIADKPERPLEGLDPCRSDGAVPRISILSDDKTLEICTMLLSGNARHIGVSMHKSSEYPIVLNLPIAAQAD